MENRAELRAFIMFSIAFCVAEKKGKRNNILFPKRHIVTETVCTLADVINGYVRTYFRLIFCIAGDFDGTIADTSQYSFILILCEGCESPGFGIGRKADVISVFQSKLLSSSAKFREVSAEVGIQSVVDGAWKTFHSGSQAALADFGTLVNVYTNNFSVVCLSCIQSRCPDTAAAGEYNLCSVCIPALHTGSDGVIAVELAAIVIFYVYIYAVFFSSSVDTLYITVTETDNGRNSDTAKETKACVAVFYCSVSSKVAGLLFFEGADVHVLSEINSFAVFYNITFGNIDCDEGYIRIGVLLFSDGGPNR